VLAVIVEDDKVPGHDLVPLANLLHPLARYGVPVPSKRSSTVHKPVAPPRTLGMTWFVSTSTTLLNLWGSLMKSGSAP
jgi:hypothetical protein